VQSYIISLYTNVIIMSVYLQITPHSISSNLTDYLSKHIPLSFVQMFNSLHILGVDMDVNLIL